MQTTQKCHDRFKFYFFQYELNLVPHQMKLVLFSFCVSLIILKAVQKFHHENVKKRNFFRFFPRHTESIDFSHSLLLPHI